MTILVSDCIALILRDIDNLKLSFGLVEALLKYSEFYSKTRLHAADLFY